MFCCLQLVDVKTAWQEMIEKVMAAHPVAIPYHLFVRKPLDREQLLVEHHPRGVVVHKLRKGRRPDLHPRQEHVTRLRVLSRQY